MDKETIGTVLSVAKQWWLFVEQLKTTAAELMVGGCAVSCHVGAKCGCFLK